MYCSQDLPSELCEHVYNLLVKRPTSHLLEVIQFCDDGPPEEIARDLFVKMHTLCPNLKHAFPDFDDVLSTPETTALAKNFIGYPGTGVDPERTPQLFPHLEWLTLYRSDALPHNFTRFDVFTSLKALEVTANTFTFTTHFPPTLERLQISSDKVLNAEDAYMDSFFDALCVKWSRLKSLKLRFGDKPITARNAERVLNSLRELEELILENDGYVATEAITRRIELTHPCLHRVPKLSITGLQAVPVWLPGITRETESNIARYGVVSSNIAHVTLDMSGRTEAQRREMFERLAEKCRVAGIQARSWDPFCSVSLLKTLTSLSLRIYNDPAPDDVFADLVPQLPLLFHLQVVLRSSGRHSSCKWLRHPRLCDLRLHYSGGVPLDEVSLTRDSLPMLCTAELEFQNLQLFKLVVHGLPMLDDLRIECAGERTDFRIQNCAALQVLQVLKFRVGELHLCDLHGLRELTLRARWVVGATRIIRVDLPQLIRAYCYLSQPEDLWRAEFVSKLKMRDEASGGHRFWLEF
eukprot:TRINITY_DN1448_c0_g1_i3.p1 TRINITY_DN1448_c0_g1~~TRINITY_DN1448_c0_g1_i3.p1  ORF type:complete len:523 (-),score=38.42 TRINITY_DN1448_c0_g1_i3:163-1731(-)